MPRSNIFDRCLTSDLSDAKESAGIFVGPQIEFMLACKVSENKMSAIENVHGYLLGKLFMAFWETTKVTTTEN